MGVLGFMGGVVRVLWAIDQKEPMSASLIGATLICAATIPALVGDTMMEMMHLSIKAALAVCFIFGGAAIKLVQKAMLKAEATELSWPPSWPGGKK